VSLLLSGYETIIVLSEKPAETFGGSAVEWLQDHNCIVFEILQEFYCGLAVEWLQDHNCIVLNPLKDLL
jgi:CDP-diacylglycerol pyrophosphatase